MTAIFLGGETPSFLPSASGFSERSDLHNTAFARASLAGTGGAYGESLDLGGLDELWLHCEFTMSTSSSSSAFTTFVSLYNGATEVFRLERSGVGYLRMQALIASVWTTVGSETAATWGGFGSREVIDVHIVGNSGTGTATLYTAGSERTTATANLASVASIDTLRTFGSSNATSQFIVADEPTIGWRLATYYPNGNGAATTWIGDYTSVDELDYTDADFIYSATANEVETFTCTGPALTGYVVRAVGVYARAKCGVGGPQNIQLALRVNGTNYFSGTKALSVGYNNVGHIWTQNPDTAADWLTTAVAAIQPGVKSIA
jgi:hypothetical protein